MSEEHEEEIKKDEQVESDREKLSENEVWGPADDKMVTIKESEHKRLIEEAAKYKDQYIRLYAEFDNARKRMDRDKLEFIKYANEGLIVEFLEILDNLQRTVDAAKEKHQDYDAFLKGIEMVMGHIFKMLENNGVKPIDTKGKMFDPHCHEVLMMEESDKHDEGAILEEFQKGYTLQEKVVRTAKVKLAKQKS